MSVRIKEFFVDFQRCIGCEACVAACAECHTHRGAPMVQVDRAVPAHGPQTVPMICMHCREPTCAMACPADAIKMDEHGIVHSSLKPRCIACRNCELACPFGVPIINEQIQQIQKCDMCFDRTVSGKKPMCASVCPTGALFYGTLEEIQALRPHSKPINRWRFGNQKVETRVWVMVPRDVDEMVVDWPAMLEGAGGPFELAMRLRERFAQEGLIARDSVDALPLTLEEVPAGTPAGPEAEFL